jgi:hypothetical protein
VLVDNNGAARPVHEKIEEQEIEVSALLSWPAASALAIHWARP